MVFRRPAPRLTLTTSVSARPLRVLALLAVSLQMAALPALAQVSAKENPSPIAPEAKTPPCADCRRDDPAPPATSDTVVITPDNKTVVPKAVMREQADFNLGSVLRRVPGIGVNGR